MKNRDKGGSPFKNGEKGEGSGPFKNGEKGGGPEARAEHWLLIAAST